ncbi:MAG: hypothetical protein ABSC23_13610 [Bryobacteraceae bacterium]|jgi:hypothetical protein
MQALQIFRVNTCLWGGQYNPIVPFLDEVPKWWDRHGYEFDTAAQIVNGYLDFFEPDFIVEVEPGLSAEIEFDKERILPLSGILTREGDRHRNGCGLDVFSLYKDLYQKEFQFVRRHPHGIIDVAAEDPSFASLAACLFGAFPEEADLAYLRRGYADAFEPEEIKLNGGALERILRGEFTSALQLGRSNLAVDYHDREDPALFVLDATAPPDLIDFWNLRAVRRHVLPIPVQWIADLSGFCKGFITANYRPLPDNPHGVMIRPTVMFGRSIATEDIERIYREYCQVDIPDANTYQPWYPSLWRPSPAFTIREMRPTLSSGQKRSQTTPADDNPAVQFECLHPDFADEYGNENRWANVVSLSDWSFTDQVATSSPSNYRTSRVPHFRHGADAVLPTTEGFVLFPRFKNSQESWRLSDGTTAINLWLSEQKIKPTPSAAGRATQQIIQTLGGFHGVTSIANGTVIRFLDELSRKPISKSAQHQAFRNRIRSATGQDHWHGHSFSTLVERNAVELGLEIRCTRCSSWTWYPLKQLDYQLSCGLCLRPFKFPITDPGNTENCKWAYRLAGPFSLPDYAEGGYCAALALRFFSGILKHHDRANVTWSAGQELELVPGNTTEADFILWYQRTQFFGNDYPTDIVFGEAKSFGKDVFGAEDVERMKSLAARFPGAIIVFATLKQAVELSQGEIQRLGELALWGREYLTDTRHTRAPVILLTGTELFASYSLHEAWKTAGAKHAQFSEAGRFRENNLRVLADLTQQLYLNLPSYGAWLELERAKRLAQARSAPQTEQM